MKFRCRSFFDAKLIGDFFLRIKLNDDTMAIWNLTQGEPVSIEGVTWPVSTDNTSANEFWDGLSVVSTTDPFTTESFYDDDDVPYEDIPDGWCNGGITHTGYNGPLYDDTGECEIVENQDYYPGCGAPDYELLGRHCSSGSCSTINNSGSWTVTGRITGRPNHRSGSVVHESYSVTVNPDFPTEICDGYREGYCYSHLGDWEGTRHEAHEGQKIYQDNIDREEVIFFWAESDSTEGCDFEDCMQGYIGTTTSSTDRSEALEISHLGRDLVTTSGSFSSTKEWEKSPDTGYGEVINETSTRSGKMWTTLQFLHSIAEDAGAAVMIYNYRLGERISSEPSDTYGAICQSSVSLKANQEDSDVDVDYFEMPRDEKLEEFIYDRFSDYIESLEIRF